MAQVRHYETGEVLFESADETIKETLEKAVKEGVNLEGAKLGGAKLGGAKLGGAKLRGAKLGAANLKRADLEGANLRGADLGRANLGGVNLKIANLRGANLKRADLTGAKLGRAKLERAKLIEAKLRGAKLRGAKLVEASLRESDLRGTNLRGVKFDKTDFKNATLGDAILTNVNLQEVLNLDSVKHHFPSSISTDSFQRSNGQIPEKFLIGVGLSPWEIESVKLYNPNLRPTEITDIVYKIDELRNSNPIQVHNLFISYGHKDSEFVDVIEGYLSKKNIRFWRDIHDAPAGPLEKIIVRAIESNQTVLLILSEASNNSDWVEFEVNRARKLEKKIGRHVICPIALDHSWKNSNWSEVLLDQIKKYHILDFSKWKDPSFFDKQFEKLVKGWDLFY